jgi:hypothetical protein
MGQFLSDASHSASVSRSTPVLQVFAEVCLDPARSAYLCYSALPHAIAPASYRETFTSESPSGSRPFPTGLAREEIFCLPLDTSTFQNT